MENMLKHKTLIREHLLNLCSFSRNCQSWKITKAMIGSHGHGHWDLQWLFESPLGNIYAVKNCDILCVLCQNSRNCLLKKSAVFNHLYGVPLVVHWDSIEVSTRDILYSSMWLKLSYSKTVKCKILVVLQRSMFPGSKRNLVAQPNMLKSSSPIKSSSLTYIHGVQLHLKRIAFRLFSRTHYLTRLRLAIMSWLKYVKGWIQDAEWDGTEAPTHLKGIKPPFKMKKRMQNFEQ